MFWLNFLLFNNIIINKIIYKKNEKSLVKKQLINNNSIILKKNMLNKKYINILFKFKNNNYYFNFNSINLEKKRIFFKFLDNSVSNGLRFTFLSSDTKLLLPYFNNIYSKEDMFFYKNFIFYNNVYINFNNWLFFFKSFLKKFNIKIIFFLSLVESSKFLKVYDKIEIIKLGVICNTVLEINFDYSFFINRSEQFFYNTFLTNYFISIFYQTLSINSYNFKINYYKKLKKIIEKSYLLR